MKMQQNDILLNMSVKHHIGDLQLAFSKAYPFLKIEFYKESPAAKSSRKKYLDGSLPLTAAGLNGSGTMVISDSMTVYQLEKELRNNFGLNADAFRKSGIMWLEITMTGDWTLQHQNQQGKELSEPTKADLCKDKDVQDNSME